METTPTFEAVISRLIELLKHEKTKLLQGAFETLPAISEEKNRYLSALSEYLSEPNIKSRLAAYERYIAEIQKLASENERLLQSAKSGVKSAQQRLTQINKEDSLVGTYTPEGEKLHMHNSSTTRRKIA